MNVIQYPSENPAMLFKSLALLFTLTMLAGCGGGLPPETSTAPPAVQQAIRVKALAIERTAIEPREVARQLFNWAEAQYPQYFPVHVSTKTFEPFLYRYYPATGIYLGLAIRGDSSFPDGVYVMGGEFGSSPLFAGAASSFMTPTDTNAEASTSAVSNGCYDLAFFDTQGARSEVIYEWDGDPRNSIKVTRTVGGDTDFEGSRVREMSVVVNQSGGSFGTGPSWSSDTTETHWLRRYGQADLSFYGYKGSGTYNADLSKGSLPDRLNYRQTWSPAYVDKRYSLKPGQSLSVTEKIDASNETIRPDGSTLPLDISVTTTKTVTFVGEEQLSVQAGTYLTCKYQIDQSQTRTFEWILLGKGILLKSYYIDLTTGNIGNSRVAKSIVLNGQPL